MRLTDKERQDLGIEDKSGVKVVSVDPGSFAEDIALQENDAIISVNRQPVFSPGDLMKVQSTLKPGPAVALHIVRSGTWISDTLLSPAGAAIVLGSAMVALAVTAYRTIKALRSK